MLLASLLVLATLASSGCSVRLLDSLTQNRKSEDEVIESVENCYYQYRDEIERFAKFLYSQDNIKRLCIYSPRRGADYCDARTDTLVQLKEDIFAECKSTDISDEDMKLLQSFAACMLANDIIIDDGGEFVTMLTEKHPEYAECLIGGCEETTTGIHKLRARAKDGSLPFPMLAVNDADCKHLFDNRHGTGQSVWDGIMYTTNNMVTGRTVVVAGYGFCSNGIAMRAKGLGANVIVTEVNPFRALEAVMDGFRVMTMDEAAPIGDIFVTATGCRDVITARHFEKMKHNAILANAGHFDVEVSKEDLEKIAVEKIERKPFITGYRTADGRILNLLADGRLVNIVAGNGHPAEIMDLSFAIQALSACWLAKHGRETEPGLYDVPKQIDNEVIRMKLDAMGLHIDSLTPEQEAYLNGK